MSSELSNSIMTSQCSPPRDPDDPRSPLRKFSLLAPAEEVDDEQSLPPVPHNTPLDPAAAGPPPPLPSPRAAAIVNLAARDTRGPVVGETKFARGGGARNGVSATSAAPVVAWRGRSVAARRTALGARALAAALCLVSFAVMAADKNKGWALDSFYKYKQYRYCVTVNVLGFLYSGYQAYAEVHHKMRGKPVIRHPMGYVFDFAMDQTFAYLLISASSAATTRTDEWVSNWGKDPFPSMARGSIAVSYLAFLAFAFSSLISAYNLFRRTI